MYLRRLVQDDVVPLGSHPQGCVRALIHIRGGTFSPHPRGTLDGLLRVTATLASESNIGPMEGYIFGQRALHPTNAIVVWIGQRQPRRAKRQDVGGDEHSADALASNKSTIRGGAVAEFFRADPLGTKLEAASVLNAPLQGFLNAVFSAEGATRPASPPPSTSVADLALLAKSCQHNLDIFGRRGRQVLKDMVSLLRDFSSGPWAELSLSSSERFNLCLAIVRSMADSWDRFVHSYDQPKFRLFEVCRDAELNDWLLDQCVRPILESHAACPSCVDELFSLKWAQRLMSECRPVALRAHRCLRNMLALAPTSSARCERKHIIGQDTRAARHRGRNLKPKTLAKVTYVRSVALAAAKRRRRVINDVSGSDPAAKRALSMGLAAMRVGRWRQRQSGGTLGVNAMRGTRRLARIRAYDCFVIENYRCQPQGLTLPQKRKLVDVEWKQLPEERKAYYEGQAEAEIKLASELDGVAVKGWLDSEARRSMRKHRTLTAKRQAIAQTFRHMQEREVWKAGSQLASFESGLKASKVLASESDKKLKDIADQIFAFDAKAMPSHSRPMRPTVVCSIRCGGLCSRDPMYERCRVGALNLHRLLKSSGVMPELPVMLRVYVDGAVECAEHHFFAKVVRASSMLFVKAEVTSSGGRSGASPRLMACVTEVKGEPIVSTSTAVFRNVICNSAGRLRRPAMDIWSLRVDRVAFSHNAGHPGFSVALGERVAYEAIDLRSTKRSARTKRSGIALPFGLSLQEKAPLNNSMLLAADRTSTTSFRYCGPEQRNSSTAKPPLRITTPMPTAMAVASRWGPCLGHTIRVLSL